MIMKSQAELAAEMQQAQIESLKADTRRTLAVAREIELRNQQTERSNNPLGNNGTLGNIPQRRC